MVLVLDGGLTSFSDLSVSMPGEVARRAARERLEGPDGNVRGGS